MKDIYAIGCDHAGVELKRALIDATSDSVEWIDCGTNDSASCDYADYAQAVSQAILSGKATKGVLICGSGVGISIAANRFKGIRAALAQCETTARLCREHNDANILALGARIVGVEVALSCLKAFMNTKFDGGERHQRRISKIENID